MPVWTQALRLRSTGAKFCSADEGASVAGLLLDTMKAQPHAWAHLLLPRARGPPPFRAWMHWPWLRKPRGRQPPCRQSALLGGGAPSPGYELDALALALEAVVRPAAVLTVGPARRLHPRGRSPTAARVDRIAAVARGDRVDPRRTRRAWGIAHRAGRQAGAGLAERECVAAERTWPARANRHHAGVKAGVRGTSPRTPELDEARVSGPSGRPRLLRPGGASARPRCRETRAGRPIR
jgi:hypothetical protein